VLFKETLIKAALRRAIDWGFSAHGVNEPACPPLQGENLIVEWLYSPGDDSSLVVHALSEKAFVERGRKRPEDLI
jgi:hypothetical protein